jgi:acetate kinase
MVNGTELRRWWSHGEDMSLLDLAGKKGLVVGIANANSIAYGCANAFHSAGAELAITYLNAKSEPYVRPLAEKLASPLIVPCDVREPGRRERAAPVRARVCESSAWLGIRLDAAANLAGGPRISTADSPVSVWVVPTNEELMIARHTLENARL